MFVLRFVLATAAALTVALPSQAATFSNWSVSGQAALGSDGNSVRLVADVAGQSGAVWAPGVLDLATLMGNQASYTEILFSFKVSGSSPAASLGDGLSLMLTSGTLPSFQSSMYGLGQFDDGVAFVIDPAAGKGASVAPASVALAATMVAGSNKPSGLNMLDSKQVDARLRLSYSATYDAWVMSLKMRDSGATSLWKQVAFMQFDNASIFSAPTDVRVGFGASTLGGERAQFELVSFKASDLRVTQVPEPAVPLLITAGLLPVLVLVRRQRLSARAA